MERVVITGAGVVSSLGLDLGTFAESLREGRAGIAPVRSFAATRPTPVAEVAGFDPAAHFDRQKAALLDRFSQLALVAAREAVKASGISFDAADGLTSAAILGTGAGGQISIGDAFERILVKGAKPHPFTVPRYMPNAAASQVSMEHGIRGPVFAVGSACASAAHAIGLAFDMVRRGAVDSALAGGSEACVNAPTLAAWDSMRVMSPDTCRPFSRNRSGMVLGEGAGIVVLERLSRAVARNAPILAELAGFGMSADAGDLLLPSQDGAARAMRAALADARLGVEAVGYVNAHGTGTAVNDSTETRAIREVFGPHADALAVSSTKSMHGHTLGAAGAIELVATLVALREGVLPPTINYAQPDPDCDLHYVPNQAEERTVEAALSNSFAFGGLNAVLAVRRYRR